MPRSPLVLLALLLALAAPAAAHAQDADTAAAPRLGRLLLAPIAGARLGFPQQLSAFVGLALAPRRTEDGWVGWSVTVEPGLGGGLVGIGRTRAFADNGTARIQLAVLRTWGDPWLVGPDRTYVGMDDTLSVRHVGFTLSVYVRVPDHEVGPGVLLSAGLAVTL